MGITWNNCFSSKRYGIENTTQDRRSDFERDWDRIIFSSPFRRLQNKTQVFPLPEEIFVHNRLTHSLEVASVGRSLGGLIGEKIAALPEVKENVDAATFYNNELKYVVAAACLAHDLGNPAFGHSGEDAISKYFRRRDTEKPEDVAFKQLFSEAQWKDLTTFEGNANALRILTMHLNGRARGGFRLTYSTLGSIIKYPCESLASGSKSEVHRKKYGYFNVDEQVFLDITKELNMVAEQTDHALVYKRHPFVYIVEAADDICYNIIDLEDAHRLGLLTYEEVRDHFLEIIQYQTSDLERVKKIAEDLSDDPNEAIAYLRAKAIGVLISKCSEVFWQHRDTILLGTFNKSLTDAIPDMQEALEKIKQVSVEKIYNAKKVIELEIAGFRIMSGLVEDFVTAALTPKPERDKEHKKLLALLPQQFVFDEAGTPYEKVMRILDFISGMTDVYALKLYRKLRGIDV
ncbi:deoxyguanosinetriphosphate triphosphohydrolase [Niabella ginsengisoli]|uniref:Deoxyguanosinetriphosphate triphosphohydrolase n=1 Tax=Niabella ginsengisoli TaxID=522298 RepID=A0ABS9SN34_9BACT|nr:deoxyguanosinetriphosphate triphosphohydrolase [Niabella ginsengisoli]MCH5599803.1 deoxyguanosinetriphosphate triphosphohydrolase [Niabella ginsengisoli]